MRFTMPPSVYRFIFPEASERAGMPNVFKRQLGFQLMKSDNWIIFHEEAFKGFFEMVGHPYESLNLQLVIINEESGCISSIFACVIDHCTRTFSALLLPISTNNKSMFPSSLQQPIETLVELSLALGSSKLVVAVDNRFQSQTSSLFRRLLYQDFQPVLPNVAANLFNENSDTILKRYTLVIFELPYNESYFYNYCGTNNNTNSCSDCHSDDTNSNDDEMQSACLLNDADIIDAKCDVSSHCTYKDLNPSCMSSNQQQSNGVNNIYSSNVLNSFTSLVHNNNGRINNNSTNDNNCLVAEMDEASDPAETNKRNHITPFVPHSSTKSSKLNEEMKILSLNSNSVLQPDDSDGNIKKHNKSFFYVKNKSNCHIRSSTCDSVKLQNVSELHTNPLTHQLHAGSINKLNQDAEPWIETRENGTSNLAPTEDRETTENVENAIIIHPAADDISPSEFDTPEYKHFRAQVALNNQIRGNNELRFSDGNQNNRHSLHNKNVDNFDNNNGHPTVSTKDICIFEGEGLLDTSQLEEHQMLCDAFAPNFSDDIVGEGSHQALAAVERFFNPYHGRSGRKSTVPSSNIHNTKDIAYYNNKNNEFHDFTHLSMNDKRQQTLKPTLANKNEEPNTDFDYYEFEEGVENQIFTGQQQQYPKSNLAQGSIDNAGLHFVDVNVAGEFDVYHNTLNSIHHDGGVDKRFFNNNGNEFYAGRSSIYSNGSGFQADLSNDYLQQQQQQEFELFLGDDGEYYVLSGYDQYGNEIYNIYDEQMAALMTQ